MIGEAHEKHIRDLRRAELRNEYPPVETLIRILGKVKFFDSSIEGETVWLSGTIDGVAMTVQLNSANAVKLYRETNAEVLKEIGL